MAEVARRYTQEQIDYGLAVVALFAGSGEKASEELAKEGKPIPKSTLQAWKNHPDGRYDRVCKLVQDKLADKIAARAESVAIAAADVELKILERIDQTYGSLDAKDLPGALRNVTTTKSLNVEKVVNPFRGRPSHITETRDATQLLASLARKLGLAAETVEGTATELPDPAAAFEPQPVS